MLGSILNLKKEEKNSGTSTEPRKQDIDTLVSETGVTWQMAYNLLKISGNDMNLAYHKISTMFSNIHD